MLLGDGQQDMDVSIVGQAVNASSRRVSYKNVYRYYKCCFLDPDTFDLEYDKTLEKDANAHTDVIFWVSLVSPTRAASAAYDGRVKIWDVETGKVRERRSTTRPPA
jgi:WD40 repeat protein